ncbi:MAG: NAD(P)H-hydrate dehydratase, partial [Bacteroidota bacterium]
MRVVTGTEMGLLDRRAQREYGLAGLILMENAGREVAAQVRARFGPAARAAVICGPGNNGGDGLVAARHLHLAGHRVSCLLAADDEAFRGDALTNLRIARALGLPLHRPADGGEDGLARALADYDVVIDALFGTGFRGVPRPPADGIIAAVNAAGRPVAAVDIPSGVEADTGAVHGAAVRAAVTVTFALPKLGCLLHPGADHAGELVVAPISLPLALADGIERHLTERAEVGAWLPKRPRDAHKGLNGRVLIVGGSPGLTGAPFLAARGALRAGAGLVTALIPAGLPAPEKPAEVMTGGLPAGPGGDLGDGAAETLFAFAEKADVLAVGPGMGCGEGAWAALSAVLRAWAGPLVLDADALNLMAARAAEVPMPRGPWILTPHPGEMARLVGAAVDRIQADRPGYAARLAARHQAVVVLKGRPTIIAAPDGRIRINPTGSPAMAAGGMGDVLTGVIAGLMGQGLGAE